MTGDTTPKWQTTTIGAGQAPLDPSLFAWLDSEGLWVGVIRLRTLLARADGEAQATHSDPDLCLVAHGNAAEPSRAHLETLATVLRDLPLHLGAVETFLKDTDIVFDTYGDGKPVVFRHQEPIAIDILSVEACDRVSPQRVTLVLLTEQPDEWATYEAILEDGVLLTVIGKDG